MELKEINLALKKFRVRIPKFKKFYRFLLFFNSEFHRPIPNTIYWLNKSFL